MANKPGSREDDAALKKWMWDLKNFQSAQESALVKATRAYIPRPEDIDYQEGSE